MVPGNGKWWCQHAESRGRRYSLMLWLILIAKLPSCGNAVAVSCFTFCNERVAFYRRKTTGSFGRPGLDLCCLSRSSGASYSELPSFLGTFSESLIHRFRKINWSYTKDADAKACHVLVITPVDRRNALFFEGLQLCNRLFGIISLLCCWELWQTVGTNK